MAQGRLDPQAPPPLEGPLGSFGDRSCSVAQIRTPGSGELRGTGLKRRRGLGSTGRCTAGCAHTTGTKPLAGAVLGLGGDNFGFPSDHAGAAGELRPGPRPLFPGRCRGSSRRAAALPRGRRSGSSSLAALRRLLGTGGGLGNESRLLSSHLASRPTEEKLRAATGPCLRCPPRSGRRALLGGCAAAARAALCGRSAGASPFPKGAHALSEPGEETPLPSRCSVFS